MTAWQTPSNLKLAERYERPEVKVTNCSPPPAEFDFNKCFSMTFGDTLEQDEVDELTMLNGVRGQTTWHTHTPASEQERFADLAALVDLHDKGSFALHSEIWKSSLVPQGQFVRLGGDLYFVVRVYRRAPLAWACVEGSGGLVTFDMSADKLTFIVVYDLGELRVFPFEVLLPAAMVLEKLPPGQVGIRLLKPGLSLQEFHTRECWSGLNEAT